MTNPQLREYLKYSCLLKDECYVNEESINNENHYWLFKLS